MSNDYMRKIKIPWYVVRIPLPINRLITILNFIIGDVKLLTEEPILLIHELMHIKDQFRFLILPYFILYIFSKKWRKKFELRAYEAEILYFKNLNILINRSRYYQLLLSDDLYFFKIFNSKREVDEWINNLISSYDIVKTLK